MPIKPLPESLVARLERASRIISRRLGKMKNIDHRRAKVRQKKTDSSHWGRRVRQMNVSRNFPGIKVVIKRSHKGRAKAIIARIRKKVKDHNSLYGQRRYFLLEPIAHPLGNGLVAMAKADFPNAEEITGGFDRARNLKTRRGQKMLALLEKNRISAKLIEKFAIEISRGTGFSEQNVLVLGCEKGKPVFMPLIDII